MVSSNQITNESAIHRCYGCGSCCRHFAYIQLSQDELKTLEDFTGLAAEEFSNNSDKAGKNRFMMFQENGDCIFLKTIDGDYSCSVYEARPLKCRGYPKTDIQNETCRVNSNR